MTVRVAIVMLGGCVRVRYFTNAQCEVSIRHDFSLDGNYDTVIVVDGPEVPEAGVVMAEDADSGEFQ